MGSERDKKSEKYANVIQERAEPNVEGMQRSNRTRKGIADVVQKKSVRCRSM